MWKSLSLAFCLLTSLAALGCRDGGVPLTPLSGKVLFRNKPVVGANVLFMPQEDGGVSSGVTDSEGVFSLTYVDGRTGVMPGEHLVTICEQAEPEAGQPDAEMGVIRLKPTRECRQMLTVDPRESFVEIDVTKSFR